MASPYPASRSAGPGRMRSSCVLLTALVALAAYYIYIPLPSSVSDPWKLMMVDCIFRGAQQVVSETLKRLGRGDKPQFQDRDWRESLFSECKEVGTF